MPQDRKGTSWASVFAPEEPGDISDELQLVAAGVRKLLPTAKIQVGTRGLTVQPRSADGFPVTVEVAGELYIIYLGAGQIEIFDWQTAVDCVAVAASNQSRLRLKLAGKLVREWQFDLLSPDGGWCALFAGGNVLYSRAAPTTTIKANEAYLENDGLEMRTRLLAQFVSAPIDE